MNHDRSKLVLPVVVLLVIVAAGLLAAGCGTDSKDSGRDDAGSSKDEKVALGMDEDVACTVYGEDVESRDVKDLADQVVAAFGKAYPDVDEEDVDLDGYHGDLTAFEAIALDQLVEAQIVEHAADKLDVTVDDDEAMSQLEDIASEGDMKLDDLLDVIEEGTGLEKDTIELAGRQTALLDAAYDELDSDDSKEYDDAKEWRDDELRPAAMDHVECGKGIDWDEDLRDDLELPDGSTVAFSDVVDQAVSSAVADSLKPDAISLGIDYEDAVVPLINDFTPLLTRLQSVVQKLNAGSIDLNRVGEGLTRQLTDMRAVRARAAKVRSQDAYLQRNHQQFVKALDAYIEALETLKKLTQSTSQSQIDAREKAYTAAIDRADKALAAWGAGLDNDPEGRTYARSIAALKSLKAAAGG